MAGCRSCRPGARPVRLERTVSGRALPVGALVLALLVLGGAPALAAEAPVRMGTAASYAVLGGTTVTNTGPSLLSGDLGVSPGSAVTGFPPGKVIHGTTHAADAAAAQAQRDLTTAFNDAAGRSPSSTVGADLGGRRLSPGVYKGPTLGLTGTLTLDAHGNPSAVFVFQAGSTLITASSSKVALVNGAAACNVFWEVGSSATLGTNSVFVGSVLALTSVSATTGASVTGRLLARNGAVTLDTNTITSTSCAAGSTAATPRPSATSSGGTGTGGAPATSTQAGTPAPGVLPFTGAPVTVTVAAGLLALVLGGTLLMLAGRSARSPGAAPWRSEERR